MSIPWCRSPYDKGGRLYAPSRKLRNLCLPDLEPITFGSLWLWMHEVHDAKKAPIHTIVCGSARPSDMDEPVIAAMLLENETYRAKTLAVAERLTNVMKETLGASWMDSWHVGLPNCYETKQGTNISHFVWLYNVIKSYGMVDFAIDRYSCCEANKTKWDENLSYWENVGKLGSIGWGYVPGNSIDPGHDYSDELKECPPENVPVIAEALEFVHKTCGKEGKQSKRDPDYETAYDMRPWTVSTKQSSSLKDFYVAWFFIDTHLIFTHFSFLGFS